MNSTILLTIGCVAVLLIVAVCIAGIVLLVRAGGRDTVSTAREDWIQRRSENDERGW